MSDRNKIEVGDKVRIWWTDQTCLEGTLQYMPQATGDLMQVVDKEGDVRYINTGSTTFEQMNKINKNPSTRYTAKRDNPNY